MIFRLWQRLNAKMKAGTLATAVKCFSTCGVCGMESLVR
jgi:hypothetical protein